jgi:hypothetical protein
MSLSAFPVTPVVYYESRKREIQIRLMNDQCDDPSCLLIDKTRVKSTSCLLLIDNARAKNKTYKRVSVR